MIFISQITPPIIKCFMPFCTIFYFYKSSKFEKIDILNKLGKFANIILFKFNV